MLENDDALQIVRADLANLVAAARRDDPSRAEVSIRHAGLVSTVCGNNYTQPDEQQLTCQSIQCARFLLLHTTQ